MAEIQVVTVQGRGICVECGNGLWGEPPCEHKKGASKEESLTPSDARRRRPENSP